jgi:poly-gamma-glutamate capsule biosynthesis protein CapA/YwtB (metallophosphatase superfamily)
MSEYLVPFIKAHQEFVICVVVVLGFLGISIQGRWERRSRKGVMKQNMELADEIKQEIDAKKKINNKKVGHPQIGPLNYNPTEQKMEPKNNTADYKDLMHKLNAAILPVMTEYLRSKEHPEALLSNTNTVLYQASQATREILEEAFKKIIPQAVDQVSKAPSRPQDFTN